MSFFGIILPLILLIGIIVIFLMSGAMSSQEVATEPPRGSSHAGGKQSLYERLGGTAAIDAAVDIFYRRVLADAYVKPFFEGVDMEKQAAKQKAFLTMVFGGPHSYSGKDMREAHKHLVHDMGLNDTHVDHILAHLRSTLAELGVDEGTIQEVIDIAESTRDDVLDR